MPGDDGFPTPLDPRPVGRRTRRPAAEGSLRRGIAARGRLPPASRGLAMTTSRRLSTLALLGGALVAQPPKALSVEGLRTEYQQSPVGIDVRAPRLSWRIEAAQRGTMQSAYQIRVAPDSGSLRRAPLWDSGKVPSTASILRSYGGPALRSATRYYWQVRVWDDSGRVSPWSAPAFWEMGLLDRADWTARL